MEQDEKDYVIATNMHDGVNNFITHFHVAPDLGGIKMLHSFLAGAQFAIHLASLGVSLLEMEAQIAQVANEISVKQSEIAH